jgi:hypothetical protein
MKSEEAALASKYLDKKTERKLIEKGNKRFYTALMLSVIWEVIVLAWWFTWSINAQRPLDDIRTYIPLVLCVIPFCPFSAHKILFSKSFYATVAYTVNESQNSSLRHAPMQDRLEVVDVLVVTFKSDSGKKFTVTYKKDKYLVNGLHYDEGDRVFFARGLKYPMEFPMPKGKDFKCPVCGRTVEAGNKVCSKCGFDF